MAKKCYLGMDVGGTNIKIVASDETLKPFFQQTIGTYASEPQKEFADKLAAEAMLLLASHNLVGALKGVCMTLPGQVDTVRNVPLKVNALGWKTCNFDLVERMEALLACPVYLVNDGNAHLLGESVKGAAQGVQDVVLLSFGTGVGGGVMSHGRLLEGDCGIAGELGHMIVQADGELCNCGNRGCLQAYCSARAVLKYTREQMKLNRDTALWTLTEGDLANLILPMIAQGASQGG